MVPKLRINAFYYVYVLKLNNDKFYIGFTKDLKSRFKSHLSGRVITTRYLRPLSLAYYSAFSSELLAIKFEKYLKSSSGSAFRNKHLL